ncbi:MAG: hypothetical protein E3J90_01075 [Promethearchaeota archaeon]|nr:MAG: hypothetical protein E3J90_01075 [Candidatus Lokiarchaeota archaeon]
MIKRKRFIKNVIFALTLFSIILSIWAISINVGNITTLDNDKFLVDFKNDPELKTASNGNPPLDYSDVSQNASMIYRLFESVKFNINASKFDNPNYTIIQIHYSNGVVGDFSMTNVGENFTYTFNPGYNTPLGFQNVSFLIYNESASLLSSSTPITNFTITSNYFISLDKTEYNRGDTVYAELGVSNYPQPYDFNWNVSVVDNDNETLQNVLFDVGNDLFQTSILIDDRFEFSNKIYYFKLNMTDVSSGTKEAAYLPFKVLNTLPQISVPTVKFSVNPLKRAEDCIITLNVTEEDPNTLPENLTVSMVIQTSTGELLAPIELTNHNNWTFSTTFSVATNKSLGIYQINIEAEDQYNGIDTYTTSITIENNPPRILSYSVNGLSMNQSITLNYGEDLVFNFDVTDVENTIAYITVALIDDKNTWYNITREYTPGMRITIRTEELITGIWYAYISVTDIDGATTYLNSDFDLGPQEINIVPDLLTPILPWISFSIGIMLGVLAGVGILYKKFKIKSMDLKKAPSKKSTQQKPAKKVKPDSSRKKDEEEKIEKAEVREVKPPSKEPQRKIKRKLK